MQVEIVVRVELRAASGATMTVPVLDVVERVEVPGLVVAVDADGLADLARPEAARVVGVLKEVLLCGDGIGG